MAAQLPNIKIRTDPSNFSGSVQFMVKWDEGKMIRVRAFLKDFPNEVELGYKIGTQEFAQKLHRLIKRCLKTGTPPKGVSWPPHSATTNKILGPHPLLHLTGFYHRYVQIIQNRATIAVGLPRGLRRPSGLPGNSKLTMRQIAVINEYGQGIVPARPLWRPAYEQVGGKAGLKKSVTKWIRQIIKQEVMKCGIASSITSSRNMSVRELLKQPTLKDTIKPQSTSNIPDDLPF